MAEMRTAFKVLDGKLKRRSYLGMLPHCGPVTQICAFTLQLCKTDDANLRF